MDYMDPDICCPKKAVKLNHSPWCVNKWKYFPRYWPFLRGIHRSLVNYPHKGQWRGALVFSLICAWINGWVKNGEAGDMRRRRAHYDVTVMSLTCLTHWSLNKMADHLQIAFSNAFCDRKSCILITISLKFVSMGPANNNESAALEPHQTGDIHYLIQISPTSLDKNIVTRLHWVKSETLSVIRHIDRHNPAFLAH